MINKYEIFLENNEIKAGRNVFQSFLKSLTALGLKDTKPTSHMSKDFLIYYINHQVDVNKLKKIMSRFRSLSMFLNKIEYLHTECGIYFGIKCDMTIEYGFSTDIDIPIGSFRLTQSVLNWILLMQSPSISSFKRELINLNYRKILLLCRIKKEVLNFNPGGFSKKLLPSIKEDIMKFGYYGYGRWENGSLNAEDYEKVKATFKSWISKFKWSKEILVSISSNSFWLYIEIKLK